MSERVVPIARLVSWLTRPGVTRVSRSMFSWNIAGKCEGPHVTEFVGYREAQAVGARVFLAAPDVEDPPLRLDLHTPCRECSQCLRKRAALWRERAKTEWSRATRTWLGTLTLSPAAHDVMLQRASQRLLRQGLQWPELSAEQQFAERWREVSRELTLWMKRLRGKSRVPFKYLLVAEAHKSGLPHVHVLLHESDEARPMRHRLLSEQWAHGFQKWNLVVDAKGATYLCKYLTKSLAARVRASQAYGARSNEREAMCERVRKRLNIPRHRFRWQSHDDKMSIAECVQHFGDTLPPAALQTQNPLGLDEVGKVTTSPPLSAAAVVSSKHEGED